MAESGISYRLDYSYERVPTIRRFALSDKRIRAIMGPFGSGKTTGCIAEIIRRGIEQRPAPDGVRRTRWAVIRNTYRQLEDTTIKSVLQQFPPAVFGRYRGVPHHDYLITKFQNVEIEILFRALDRPEHISNLLSLELTGAWINEAREVPKAIWDALDGRIDRFPPVRDGGATWAGIMMDTNPPEDDSEFYKYFEETRPENAEIFKQPSGLSDEAENVMTPQEMEKILTGELKSPTAGLKPHYYTELAKGKSLDYVNVYIHGMYGYVKEGMPVYDKSYNDSIHVSSDSLIPIGSREILVALDFGLTPAAAIIQITPRGYFDCLEELVSDGMGIEQFILNYLKPALAMRYPNNPIIVTGDPAGNQRSQTDEKTCFDILRHYKFDVKPADSNDLVARITALEYFLCRMTDGKPTFRLDPSCKMIRKGFNKGYYFKKDEKEGKITKEPVKNIYSHIMNALEYGAMYLLRGMRRAERPKRHHRQYQPASIAGY